MGILNIDEARSSLQQLEHAFRCRPSSQIIQNLGAVYFTLGDTERALPYAKKATELNPKDSAAFFNLGMIYKDLGRHEESAPMVKRAAELEPLNPYYRLGAAEALLRKGQWREAWPTYETGRLTKEGAAIALEVGLDVKLWDGKEPVGELLVINEGGAGDRISYTRFLPELTKRGINWKFFPFDELRPFYARLPWIPPDRLLKDGDSTKPTHWTTTFSLMANLEATPDTVPYFPAPFTADPELVKKFAISKTDGLPVVGLAWSASELHQGGRKIRSLSEGQAMRLVCMTGDLVHWVNLQPGYRMPYPVTNIAGFSSWQDTAAVIANLDAVVSVDCGTLHLAGAMDKPLSVLLSGNSDWKFLESGERCAWYPTARLFRNESVGFENAITNLIATVRRGEGFGYART